MSFLKFRNRLLTFIVIHGVTFCHVAHAQFVKLDKFERNISLYPWAIALNGEMAIGSIQTRDLEYAIFRWTRDEGVEILGDFSRNGDIISVSGASADGVFVVGTIQNGGVLGDFQAIRWTVNDGVIKQLPLLESGEINSVATGISSRGEVVIGNRYFSGLPEAFRWTKLEGMRGLGYLATEETTSKISSARGISENGDVIVGFSSIEGVDPVTGAFKREAFRWTRDTEMVGLGFLSGEPLLSEARAVSGNGDIVVGLSQGMNGIEAFRWTESTGMVGLGDLLGGSFFSQATGISANGRVIIGTSDSQHGVEAFRWTEEKGMQRVVEWLQDSGSPVNEGLILAFPTSISADGSVIVGSNYRLAGDSGVMGSGWLARGDSGAILLQEFTQSFGTTASISLVAHSLPSTILNGSHHQLLLSQAHLGNENSFWVSGDFAHHDRRDTDLSIGEVGVAHDFVSGLRGGIGFGKGYLDQDLTFGGRHEVDGQYLVVELDWKLDGSPMVLSITGVYGDWNADIERGYLNGGVPDQSKGTTDVDTLSLRVRADWLDLFKCCGFSFSPRVSYTLTHIKSDSYTETGGGFPAAFDSQSHTTQEIRVGLTAETALTDTTKFRGILEGVYRMDQAGADFNGQVIGLFGFSIPGAATDQEWVRIGAEIEHRISDNKTVTATVFGATRGEDPEVSAALDFKITF